MRPSLKVGGVQPDTSQSPFCLTSTANLPADKVHIALVGSTLSVLGRLKILELVETVVIDTAASLMTNSLIGSPRDIMALAGPVEGAVLFDSPHRKFYLS